MGQLLELLPTDVPVDARSRSRTATRRLPLPEHPRATVTWHDLPTGAPPGEAIVDAMRNADIDANARVSGHGRSRSRAAHPSQPLRGSRNVACSGCGARLLEASGAAAKPTTPDLLRQDAPHDLETPVERLGRIDRDVIDAVGSAMAIGVLLWIPPLVDQLTGTGNLGAIVRYFTSSGESAGLRVGYSAVAQQLGPDANWLRGLDHDHSFGFVYLLRHGSIPIPVAVLPFALALWYSAVAAGGTSCTSGRSSRR